MTNRQAEKRNRFSRIFPNRVDALRDTLRKLSNCSNRNNYDWDDQKVQAAWKLIAVEFADVAATYGLTFNIEVKQTESKQLNDGKESHNF